MAQSEEIAKNLYYFTKIFKGKSKTFRAKCYKIGSCNSDSELQMINSVLNSISTISEDKSNRFQTLDKFECKVINEGEYICVTLSNQYYPKTLKQYMDALDGEEVDERTVLSFAYQIARCLQDLHKQDLVKFHGNLKASNVFLDQEDNVVATGDFFIKHITGKVHEDKNLYQAMLNHLPPEFFTFGNDRDQYADIWALGVIVYQLSTGGELPFNEVTEEDEFDQFETKRSIININYDKLEDRDDTQLLLDQIFTIKPHNRITADEILKSLENKIDMKRLKTAMKRASENIYDSDDSGTEDIKRKLDFLIDGDASEDEIMKRHSVTSGLRQNKTFKSKGDTEVINDEKTDEDFKHLDNLVKGHVSTSNKSPNDFMDNLPDSYASESQAEDSSRRNQTSNDGSESQSEESKVSDSIESAGQMARARQKKTVKCQIAKEDERIDTNMMSLIKIVMLNQEKLLLFSASQNYFMSIKQKKLRNLDFFSPLSPTEAVLYFPPCNGVFDNNMLVVYKDGKLLLVDLLQSAERQKLHMVSKRVNFNHLESQSVADSITEKSDAGDGKFLIPLSGHEFAMVFEEAVKIFEISDFALKCVKEYNELIPDRISYISYYHTNRNLTHLAVGSESSSQVCLYNLKQDLIEKTLEFDEESVTSVFEIGKKYIAATSLNGHLAVWDKHTYIQILKDQVMEAVYITCKIPNSDYYALGGQGPLIIYNGLDKAVEVKVKNLNGGIVDIAFNEVQNILVFGDEEGTLFTYDVSHLLE